MRVFEKSDELRMFGAGIWLWENGLRALQEIGVRDAVMAANGLKASAWEIRDHRNKLVRRRLSTDTDPIYVPLREDLYAALIAAARGAGVDIRLASRAVSTSSDGLVRFANDASVGADLVVVADGVRSRLRDSLNLTQRVYELDVGATRLLVPRLPAEQSHNVIVENWRGGRTLLYNPTTPSLTYLCFVAPVNDHLGNARPLNKESWCRSFPHLSWLIERVGTDGHWDLMAAVNCKRWSSGRAAVIGDAAHALPPTLGQAANLTFSNAVALAKVLADCTTGEIPTRLREWERIMRPITDHAQKWSRYYSALSHLAPRNMDLAKSLLVKYGTRLPRVEHHLNLAARTSVNV